MNAPTEPETGSGGLTVAKSSLVVQFRADSDAIRELLVPPPLVPTDEGEQGWIIISETILPNARERRELPLEKTQFTETAIGAPCRYGGSDYSVYPLLYLDRVTDRFHRGYVRGIADIAKSWWHRTCPGRREPTDGDTVVGNANHGGSTMVETFLKLEQEIGQEGLPDQFFNPIYHRYLPARQVDSGQQIANDIGSPQRNSLSIGSVWEGEAAVSFGGWRNGILGDLGAEATMGYYVTTSYRHLGEKTLVEVDPSWGDHIE